jgi:hypothetical protein
LIDVRKKFLATGKPPAKVTEVEYKFDGEATEDQVSKALKHGGDDKMFASNRKWKEFGGLD